MQAITNDTTRGGFFPATAMPDPDWWQALWPKPQQVLAALGIRPDMKVVDLCCGDGLFTAPLALLVRHVIAIELIQTCWRLRERRLPQPGRPTATLSKGDAHAVAELVRRPVDFVLMANTFHGVPNKARLAHAVAAILKPGRRFAVINWHHRPREETIVLGKPRGPKTEMRMKPSDVAAEVETANLKLVYVIELPPYHYGAIFENPVH